jgi:hypothetical protein
VIGTGLECGVLCLNRGHYRPDFSSTGLLRDATVYYNIRNGKDLVEAVDAGHRFMAEGDSMSGIAAAQNYALAANEMRRYVRLLESAHSEGRVTVAAANVLSMQAEAIINGLVRMK